MNTEIQPNTNYIHTYPHTYKHVFNIIKRFKFDDNMKGMRRWISTLQFHIFYKHYEVDYECYQKLKRYVG